MITLVSLASILLSAISVYVSIRLIRRQSILAEYWRIRHEDTLRELRTADPPIYRKIILSSVLRVLQ